MFFNKKRLYKNQKKVGLFAISFVAMWPLLFIKAINLPWCLGGDYELAELSVIFSLRNIVAYISFIMFFIAIKFERRIASFLKGSPCSNPFKIGKFIDKNYSYYNSLATLLTIVSVLMLEYNTFRDLFILLAIIFVLYICYIKTNQFYSNPLFAFLGFKIAQTDDDKDLNNKLFPKGSIVLYKDSMTEDSIVDIYELLNGIYVAKILK